MILPNKKQIDSKDLPFWQRDIKDLFINKRLKTKELALFNEKLAFLLGSGITIKTALPIIQMQLNDKFLNNTIAKIHKSILSGDSLFIAMSETKVFPKEMLGFIAVGEKTGKLSEVCARLAAFYALSAKTEGELKAALIYPIAVTIMMFSVIIIAIVFVLPSYANIFYSADIDLPFISRVLLSISNIITRNFFKIIIGLILCIGLIVLFFKTPNGKKLLSRLELKIPILCARINFRLAEVLHISLSSNLSINETLPLCRQIFKNIIVKNDLNDIINKINSGSSFWTTIENIKYIDITIISMSRVGEETGKLAETISSCKKYLSENYEYKIKRFSKLIEPIITIGLGVFLLIVVLAIIMPTFELAFVL